MNYSIFWARLLGLYAVVLAVGVLLDLNKYHELLMSLANNHVDLMMMGVFTMLLGLVILVTHHLWKGWPILVTLLGYWITFKGIMLSFYPEFFVKVLSFWHDKMFLAPLPSLIIGLILLYFGFVYKPKA